ncbi:MAG: T9SS type A sorting domain-containing protein [Fidelibacterota bacterium]|nr:MAG: T9SS type A sorting domain-containing protein [Candidatus Neomarinimicrobiota bacterium]
MRRYFRALLVFLTASSTLLPQKPAPICGLPHIAHMPPGEATILYKPGVPSENPTFLIREHYNSSTLIEVDFYLMHDEATFSVYAEAAEVDSMRVDSIAVAELVAAFRDHTFEGSVDSSSGIKAIAEDVFGSPPSWYRNGKVFILLIDVRDDYVPDSSEFFVAGYFDPLDQTQYGNQANIIYLDTNPGQLTGEYIKLQIRTLAHEYQHLIHYGHDNNEENWINEGLSELSPVLMGLPHRDFTLYLTDTNVRLDIFPGELADYARTGLFFLYTWIRFGTPFIRNMIARTENGITALENTLSSFGYPPFDDYLYGWHLANFIQGDGSYGKYGPFPQPVMHDVIISFPENDFHRQVKRLGAHWTTITGGWNLYLSAVRSGSEPRLTLINGNDRTLIPAPQLTSIGFQDSTFGIDYSELVVLATSSTAVSDSVSYALFVDAEGGFEETIISYDGDKGADEEVPWISLGDERGEGEAALVFDIPDNSADLSAVHFYAQTSDSVRVRVYSQALVPDSVIYTASINAPLGSKWTVHRLPLGIQEGNQRVYVSVASANNALAYNENDTTSHFSYYRFPDSTSFFRLDRLKVTLPSGHDKILSGNWSIRLSYLVPDTSEDEIDVPLAVGYFYPNPFIIEGSSRSVVKLEINPGKSAEVRLYNILGQEIWKHTRPAGVPSPVEWHGLMDDGRLAPSGVYLARIAVSDAMVYRKLVLIR